LERAGLLLGGWLLHDHRWRQFVVTELSNPLAVNPLKYGSSEVDPDPVVALIKLRNEVYALNRNTIEVFDNVGGELFPFHVLMERKFKKVLSERTLLHLH
jgi:hypothetical protein